MAFGAQQDSLRAEIVSHTSIRGIAALGVAMGHFLLTFMGPGMPGLRERVLSIDVFVDLFFVLSGFIICYIYAARFADRLSLGEAVDFLLRRFARLAPLHYATTTAFLLFLFVKSDLTPAHLDDIPSNYLMIHAWFPKFDSILLPTWSISAEVAMYLAFPAIAAMVSGSRRWWVLLVIAATTYAILMFRFNGLHFDKETNLLRVIAGFLTGMVAWKVWNDGPRSSQAALNAIQIVGTLSIVTVLVLDASHVYLPMAFAALIYSTADDRGPVATFLQTRALYLSGVWSYSIYLNHMLVAAALWTIKWPLDRIVVLPTALWVGLGLAITLVVSAFTYRWIEVAGKRAILSRVARRRASSTH